MHFQRRSSAWLLAGRDLEVDLSDKNAAKLGTPFEPYIAAGRRLGARTGTSKDNQGGPLA